MAVLQKLGTEYVEFYASIAGKQLAAAKAAGCRPGAWRSHSDLLTPRLYLSAGSVHPPNGGARIAGSQDG